MPKLSKQQTIDRLQRENVGLKLAREDAERRCLNAQTERTNAMRLVRIERHRDVIRRFIDKVSASTIPGDAVVAAGCSGPTGMTLLCFSIQELKDLAAAAGRLLPELSDAEAR